MSNPHIEGTPAQPRHKRTNKFYWVGGLTACVYLLTLIFYLRGPQAHSTMARELFAWFLVVSLLFLFWKGYQLINQSADVLQVSTILCFAAFFCLTAFFTFPFHSTDVFGYINRGWQQVHYGQNPYVYVVSDINQWEHDPMLWDHWINNPDPYGSLFTLLARILCQMGQGNWWLTLSLFKGVNLFCHDPSSRMDYLQEDAKGGSAG